MDVHTPPASSPLPPAAASDIDITTITLQQATNKSSCLHPCSYPQKPPGSWTQGSHLSPKHPNLPAVRMRLTPLIHLNHHLQPARHRSFFRLLLYNHVRVRNLITNYLTIGSRHHLNPPGCDDLISRD